MMKFGIEPINPEKEPIMVNSLTILSQVFPGFRFEREDTQDTFIYGYGEMYLDCIMHYLRNTFANTEIRISEPTVWFSEGVADQSQTIVNVVHENIRLSFICSPFPQKLIQWTQEANATLEDQKALLLKLNFDELFIDSIWNQDNKASQNLLIEETLKEDEERGLL